MWGELPCLQFWVRAAWKDCPLSTGDLKNLPLPTLSLSLKPVSSPSSRQWLDQRRASRHPPLGESTSVHLAFSWSCMCLSWNLSEIRPQESQWDSYLLPLRSPGFLAGCWVQQREGGPVSRVWILGELQVQWTIFIGFLERILEIPGWMGTSEAWDILSALCCFPSPKNLDSGSPWNPEQ